MSEKAPRPLPLVIKALKNAIPGSSPLRREGLGLLNRLERETTHPANPQQCWEDLRKIVTFFETDSAAPEAPNWPALAEEIYTDPKAYLRYLRAEDKAAPTALSYSLA